MNHTWSTFLADTAETIGVAMAFTFASVGFRLWSVDEPQRAHIVLAACLGALIVCGAATAALNNTGTTFNGPTTGLIGGPNQVWYISTSMLVRDTAGSAALMLDLHDGITAQVSQGLGSTATNTEMPWTASFVSFQTAAMSYTGRARDAGSTSGQIMATTTVSGGATNKVSSITAVRLA